MPVQSQSVEPGSLATMMEVWASDSSPHTLDSLEECEARLARLVLLARTEDNYTIIYNNYI